MRKENKRKREGEESGERTYEYSDQRNLASALGLAKQLLFRGYHVSVKINK